MDRIRELSDASVPFNFDIHALFFSKDAVGIETALHERLADVRINIVNRRRSSFELRRRMLRRTWRACRELLQFQDLPEAWSAPVSGSAPGLHSGPGNFVITISRTPRRQRNASISVIAVQVLAVRSKDA